MDEKALLAELNELKERYAEQERELTPARLALADEEKGLSTLKLRVALEELSTCMQELGGPLLDGEISAADHTRFSCALTQLRLAFPRSPEIISARRSVGPPGRAWG
jgi:hypothetical protein